MNNLTLESPAFDHGQPIPKKYTADGQDLSPPLRWSKLPAGTRELALVVDDPDAPTADPWVHWVLYKLSPELKGLPEGVAKNATLANPPGAVQGHNSFAKVGYNGPSPPKGHGVHHYHFTLYALNAPLQLGPDVAKKSLLAAMNGHVLGQGELIGTYERK